MVNLRCSDRSKKAGIRRDDVDARSLWSEESILRDMGDTG